MIIKGAADEGSPGISILNEYKTTEVEYTTIKYNNIDYVNLIKLKLNETTTLTKLYYFSGIETLRNLGGLININNFNCGFYF